MYKLYLKRSVDIFISSILIVISLPLIAVSAIGIIVSSPGSPFFKQKRVGRDGKIFELYKLRTMTVNKSRNAEQTRSDDPEVLMIGKPIRRLKIDELPQLFNVLFGEMSLIGPRPCLQVTYDEMPDWAKKRFSARPGLTGLAQINGNIDLTWEQRWRWDIKYVNNIFFYFDLYILARTVLVIILGEGRFRRAI